VSDRIYECPKCDDLLQVEYDIEEAKARLMKSDWQNRPISVWKYAELIPVETSKVITLYEGGTGLHYCHKLGAILGLDKLYVKNEGENPTGSFKDRGMTVGVTKAVEAGAKSVICASTGNTSASLSAYSAKAGLNTIVLIPSGKIAYGKLAQAMVHGARIVQVNGNFDEALEIVMEICKKNPQIYLLNSINPFRIEGQKTVAFEICNQLGRVPDFIVMPVGNAGNISATWKGFTEFLELKMTSSLPKMVGVQAEGAAPIAYAVKGRMNSIQPVKKPETVATAIRIGAPVSWKKALMAIYRSDGTALTVSDQEILEAQSLLARVEGLFVEPASASPIAGLKKLVREGVVDRKDMVVCIATGHGLKDPEIISKMHEKPVEFDAETGTIERFLSKLEEEITPIVT
jgi:threonine synthase